MQDTEFYRCPLGTEPPWTIERVKLESVNQREDVWATHQENLRQPCPECGAFGFLNDHAPE